jgi:hypothetical protein
LQLRESVLDIADNVPHRAEAENCSHSSAFDLNRRALKSYSKRIFERFAVTERTSSVAKKMYKDSFRLRTAGMISNKAERDTVTTTA